MAETTTTPNRIHFASGGAVRRARGNPAASFIWAPSAENSSFVPKSIDAAVRIAQLL